MEATCCHYFQALNRETLFFGVEKRLFFLMLALASSLVLTSLFTPSMLVFGSVILSIGLSIGQRLTKQDANFLSVYQRHLRYQQRYEPIPFLVSATAVPSPALPRALRRKV